jgi:hypothetical protein
MSYCSPKQLLSKDKKVENSCIDEELINEMVKIYNEKKTIKINEDIPSNEKLNLLIKNLDDEISCKKDYCLSDAVIFSEIKDKIKENFRPLVPKKWLNNKKTWLNTYNILDSLNQYNDAFSDFKFLTVSPIDFDTKISPMGVSNRICVDRKLCSLEIEKYINKNIFRLGAVFNLDKHDESGSHWTALFTDLKKGEIYYYDSVARSYPSEIVKLVKRIISQGNQLILENKFNLNEKEYPLRIVNNEITMTELCNFLLKNNNFILYRFCYLLPVKRKYDIHMEYNYELIGKIISTILEIIDISKKEHYAIIPGLDELIAHIHDKTLNIDQFIINWINVNINKAINNLLSSIKIIGNDNERATVEDIELKDDKFVFKLDTPIKNNNLIDMSFKGFKNCIQHQFKNTECGMYSINFIDNFLLGNKSFDEIIKEPIDDVSMNKLRYTKYFSPL